MFHLKTLAKSPVIKYELAKVLPVANNLVQARNYADHQIPDRLRDVATAKGKRVKIIRTYDGTVYLLFTYKSK